MFNYKYLKKLSKENTSIIQPIYKSELKDEIK